MTTKDGARWWLRPSAAVMLAVAYDGINKPLTLREEFTCSVPVLLLMGLRHYLVLDFHRIPS
jgi:hypothetical protein